jgi:integrase
MVRNRKIDIRSRRLALAARGEPYWQALQRGLAIGYYRPLKGGDGTWWGRVRIGTRYTVEALATADDHVEADGADVLDWGQAQAAVRAWAERQGSAGPLTVETAIREYLADLRASKGERVATAAAGRLDKHVPAELRARRVAELTVHDLRVWRNGMLPENADEERLRRSRDTANRVMTILRAALNRAFNNDRVADDRAWRRLEPFKGVGVARKVLLDPIQIQLLLDACGPGGGLRELVAVGAMTGARLGELTAARVRDLDLEAGCLKLDGKTGAREVHLAPATMLLLRRVASGKSPEDHLLTPPGRTAWTANLHKRRFAAAVTKAGLDPATVFYSLRHSYISHALKRLVPVKALATATGTSMSMIEKHYAKLIVSDQRRYAEIACPELNVDESGAKVVPLREAAT